jgi:hypothetical protein
MKEFSPSQKFSEQSAETARFQAWNCLLVILYSARMVAQESPVATTWYLLQFPAVPVNVGPGILDVAVRVGEILVEESGVRTQYR